MDMDNRDWYLTNRDCLLFIAYHALSTPLYCIPSYSTAEANVVKYLGPEFETAEGKVKVRVRGRLYLT